MSSRPNFDQESFQALLANAFSVQQSGMDPQSLAAFIEIQHALAAADGDVDSSLHLIAERARNVAHANGIGIALLQGNQLVHRAGSGSASENVGRHPAAVFSAPARNHARAEILRVENARDDSRIEAEICRQFDAQALLMMPIYRDRIMIGVMEVFFSEPHAFSQGEIRTYQLMSTLVADATAAPIQPPTATIDAPVTTVSHALWRMQSQNQPASDLGTDLEEEVVPGPVFGPLDPDPWYVPVFRAVSASTQNLAARWHSLQVTPTITRALQRMSRHKLQWNIAAIPLFFGLVIAAAIAHHYSTTPPVADSAPRNSGAASQPTLPARQLDTAPPVKVQTGTPNPAARNPKSAFRRVWVGQNEVDEVSEDVTIRHFQSRPSPRRARSLSKEVAFGKDVTVRYFNSPDGQLRPRPVAASDHPARDPFPASKQ
jgi:GAF domain-containing protein